MRKILSVVIVIAAAGFLLGSFFAISQTGPQSGDKNFFAQPMPPAVISNAPYPGWDYFVYYLMSNGTIMAIEYESQPLVLQTLADCAIPTSETNNMSAAVPCMFASAASHGEGVLNATGYSDMALIDRHAGAYYVNASTSPPSIQLKPGWTKCSNPNYGNGTNTCNG